MAMTADAYEPTASRKLAVTMTRASESTLRPGQPLVELNSNPSLETAADRAERLPTAAWFRPGGDVSPGVLRPLLPANGAVELPIGEQGKPLEAFSRVEQESRFGWDLGSVRIHTGPSAERSASGLHARAYTLGHHMIFGHGEYNPRSISGRALLSHELTHVIQQSTGAAPLGFQRKEPDSPITETAVPETAGGPAGSGGLGPATELDDGMRIQLLTTAAPLEQRLPAWLPPDLRGEILRGEIAPGVSRRPGPPPWGDIVIWVAPNSARQLVEIYQEFPSDEVFYADVAQGDTYVANILFDVYSAYNRDMAYFVEQKGLSPGSARNELRRINDEVFRLVIEASMTILVSGASISAVSLTQRSLVEAAERTGFARRQTEKVTFVTLEQQKKAIDTLVTGVSKAGRPSAEAVINARKALVAGIATMEDYAIVLREAVEDAWLYITATRKAFGKPSNLDNWEVMQGACGIGRDCSAASIASMSSGSSKPVIIRRFQAAEVVASPSIKSGSHQFITVEFSDGTKFLVDPTFAQFLRAEGKALQRGSNIRNLVMSEEAMVELAESLLREGFTELDDVTAALYVRYMQAVTTQAEGLGEASVPVMARKILDGSGAHGKDVVGAGQAGIVSDLGEELFGQEGLLDEAEKAHVLLKHAGGSDELMIRLEWLINRIDERK